MSASAKCIQLTLVLFNLLLAIFGCYLLYAASQAVGSNENTLTASGAVLLVFGLVGIFGAFSRSKCFLILYVLAMTIIAIFLGISASFSTIAVNDPAKISSMSSIAWDNIGNDARAQFQTANNCCGYAITIANIPATKYANCPVAGVLTSCKPAFEQAVTTLLTQSSTLIFVTVAVVVLADILAIVLIVDNQKREHGFGYSSV